MVLCLHAWNPPGSTTFKSFNMRLSNKCFSSPAPMRDNPNDTVSYMEKHDMRTIAACDSVNCKAFKRFSNQSRSSMSGLMFGTFSPLVAFITAISSWKVLKTGLSLRRKPPMRRVIGPAPSSLPSASSAALVSASTSPVDSNAHRAQLHV